MLNTVLKALARAIRQLREFKWIKIGKGRIQSIPICRCHDFVRTHHKDSTKKLLHLINIFIKVVKYKISTQKAKAFLYTNDNHTEKKIREIILLYTGNFAYKKTIPLTMLFK